MLAADAASEFERALGANRQQVSFVALWEAFKHMAFLPVEDIPKPGTESDTIEFYVATRPVGVGEALDTAAPLAAHLSLTRVFEREVIGDSLEFAVLACFVGLPRIDAHAVYGIGGPPARAFPVPPHPGSPTLTAQEFVEAVEALPQFAVLARGGTVERVQWYVQPV